MATAGKIYIVPNKAEQRWDLVVKNDGDTTIGVTNNILLEDSLDDDTHDDESRFGHGLLVNPGGVSHQSFPKGETYTHGARNEHPIDEDCYIRVGLRDLAERAVRLPPLDGKPIVIDIADDLRWYDGDPSTAKPDTYYMDNYAQKAKHALHSDVADGDSIIAQIAKLMGGRASPSRRKVTPKGHVIVKAVNGPDGKLKHWDVRFTNTGDAGFMGTAVFKDAGKNAGRGLESMAVPDKGSSAELRILAGEDYGVRPGPGTVIRVGIRGHSSFEFKLPRRGSKRINVKDFKEGQSKFQPDFFNKKSLREKRREKIGRVKFYQNGKLLKLREAVFMGPEAKARSSWNPPRLSISNVRAPNSGWEIELEGTMPWDDDRGDLGFVPKFLINGQPADDLFGRRAVMGDDYQTWTLARGADLSGFDVGNGAELTIDTGALGWSTTIKLPGPTAHHKNDAGEWVFREHKAHRWELEQELRSV